mgnify:CR=1 FL=1
MPYLNRSAVARISLFILSAALAPAADRVVILKADGLPPRLVDRYVAEGHLPHIREVFYQNGTRLNNFYVRGLSLSAPSWSLLDTGHPLVIRGNVEYDRYTLRAYDYLNFFPFYLGYALSRHVDMAGVELLDEYGVPLLIDHFPYDQRYQGFQLLQRGVRWTTLEAALKRPFTGRPVKQVFDEWQIGVSMSSSLNQQTERELLAAIADPKIRYADYFTGEYDHVAHLTEEGAGVAGVSRRRLAFSADHQGAIGGFDIDGGFVDAGKFHGNRVGLGCFAHLGGRNALGGMQLLFEFAEQIRRQLVESGLAQGQHGARSQGDCGSHPQRQCARCIRPWAGREPTVLVRPSRPSSAATPAMAGEPKGVVETLARATATTSR